jgi:hypothetical protein
MVRQRGYVQVLKTLAGGDESFGKIKLSETARAALL